MNRIVILSTQKRHKEFVQIIESKFSRNVHFIMDDDLLNIKLLKKINPEWIFVPHWNKFINETIWKNWKTIIFHMTDLPYGRGGSPLQNLIKRGHKYSYLSSIECSNGIDEGPIFLKTKYSLKGSAKQIFKRVDKAILKQIFILLEKNVEAKPQKGKPVIFKRRKPEQSDLNYCNTGDLISWYDQIRMLDCKGYPYAFITYNGMRIEFTDSKLKNGTISAKVNIRPN